MDKNNDIVYDKRFKEYRIIPVSRIKYYISYYNIGWIRVPKWLYYKCNAAFYYREIIRDHTRKKFENLFIVGKHDYIYTNDKRTIGRHDKEKN